MKRCISMLLAVVLILSGIGVAADLSLSERFDRLETEYLPALKTLLNECAQSDIATDYEMVDYTVISEFIKFGREEITTNPTRATYVADRLDSMYDDAVSNLNAYKASIKTPYKANRYVTSMDKVTLDGQGIIAAVIPGNDQQSIIN